MNEQSMKTEIGVPYLVVWRDDGETLQSEVLLLSGTNPRSLSNNDWVEHAALSEGYTSEDVRSMLERGYDLYLVCDFPENFYV